MAVIEYVAGRSWKAVELFGSARLCVSQIYLRFRSFLLIWQEYLKCHLQAMVSTDFFVLRTAPFSAAVVFLILSHDLRCSSLCLPIQTAERTHNNSSAFLSGVPHRGTYSVTGTEVIEAHFRTRRSYAYTGSLHGSLAHIVAGQARRRIARRRW